MQMEDKAHVRYSALTSREDLKDRENSIEAREDLRDHEKSVEDQRFRSEQRVVFPWKSICLAIFLLSVGTLFFIVAHFILTGQMGGDASQGYGFVVLGIIVFLPGFYETRIAYYAWRGASGYSYSSIPIY